MAEEEIQEMVEVQRRIFLLCHKKFVSQISRIKIKKLLISLRNLTENVRQKEHLLLNVLASSTQKTGEL